jgi:hypothetical protein
MDPKVFERVYGNLLSTDYRLTQDDIDYAVPILMNFYKFSLYPLVHLNKKFYIGKMSFTFNEKITEGIKSRNLPSVLTEDFWPELKAVPEYQKELKFMLNIATTAMYNTLGVLKIHPEKAFDKVFNNAVINLSKEHHFDSSVFDTIILVQIKQENGAIIKMIKNQYFDLVPLLDMELDNNLKIKYSKELKMRKYFMNKNF